MRSMALFMLLVLGLTADITAMAQDKPASKFALPATDDGVAGDGPVRRQKWFQDHWVARREKFAADAADKQNAVVFFGDSITEGWGNRLGSAFPGVKLLTAASVAIRLAACSCACKKMCSVSSRQPSSCSWAPTTWRNKPPRHRLLATSN